MAYVNRNASHINHRAHTDYITALYNAEMYFAECPRHCITLLKPGGNYMYHEDGFKESVRLHRGPLSGWGEERRLVTFPIVTNMFCIELNSYAALPTLLVQYCVSLLFVCFGATAPGGPGPPHPRGF
jgi:hypothetical protein